MGENEIPFDVLAAAAADGVILIDDQSTILFVNPAAGQIFGYEPAEMVGKNLTYLMPERLRQIHLTSLERYIATRQRHISWHDVELTGLHKSGREFPIEVSFTEYTSQGRRFFTGFVRDVTERKQAEEALRVRAGELQVRRARQAALGAEIHAAFASKAHGDLRSILQASAESVVRHLDAAFARIWTLNNQENLLELQASAGQYTRLNGEYARILVGEAHIGGIAQERKPYIANDLVNDPLTEHPEWAEQERIIALAGYPLIVEGRLVGVLAMFARQGLGPETLEALASVADTIAQGAERKQTEEKLVAHQRQWEEAQLLACLGSWSWNIPTGALTWSDELYRIFGLDKEAFCPTHQTFPDLLHPDDRALFEGALDDCLKGHRPYDCEFRVVRPDGTLRTLQSRGQAIFDETGKPLRMIGTAQDITERKRAEERIRELGAIVESSDDAIFGRTLDGLITSWNKGAEKIYGYAENEVIGQPVSILVPVDRQDEAPEILGRVAQGESTSHYETVRRRKDGQEIHVSLTISPIRNWEGRIVGASVIARDITERKRIDEALRQSEKRFAAFMANMPAFAWIKDVQGRYVYVNQMMEKLRPYSTGWCGKTDAEIWPSEIAAHYTANDQKVITSRKALQTVEPYSLEGEQRCVLVSKFPIFDETGAVAMVGGASVEITERVRTEEALRESEERFRELAENIDEVFWMSDPKNTRIIYVSPAYERIWGRSRDSLYAFPKSWTEAIHPEDKGRVVERIANRELQGSHDLTYRIARPDGSIRRIRDRGFPVYDASGNIVRIAGISEDVTESKEAEEALQQANAQLHVLSRRLFQIQEDERRHLARELHDQMGQALTAAKLNLQAAQRLEERGLIARKLDDGIAVLETLLQQARQISLDLRPPLLDDLGLVPALRWYLDQQAQRADLRVEFFADPALERVDAAIETACFRVAQEALTNVVRHARAQTVSVELHRTPEALHLVVRDDGIGFDVMTAEQGASLGLLGMRERVALLAGEMDCKSAPGRGTEIHAFFPVRTRPDAQEQGP